MAFVSSYSHITGASIPTASWERAWWLLESWKAYVQAFPCAPRVRMSARELENGDVRLWVQTCCENPEELEEWMASDVTAPRLLGKLDPSPYDVTDDAYEDLS